MPFRRDEAKRIAELLGVPRLASMGAQWEREVCQLEALVALASWRSQSLEVRVHALIDALDATREPAVEYGKWGDDF